MPREVKPHVDVISAALVRGTLTLILSALWSSAGAWAQTPSPDEVAKCRSIAETTAQFACFHRLNEKLKRAVQETPAAAAPVNAAPSPGPVAPSAPAPASPPAPAAAASIPVCAGLPNPQRRLSCYDNKWPPAPAAPTPPLPMNN